MGISASTDCSYIDFQFCYILCLLFFLSQIYNKEKEQEKFTSNIIIGFVACNHPVEVHFNIHKSK